MQAKFQIQFTFSYLGKSSNRQFLSKMIIKMFVFFFTSFLAFSKSSFICPQYSWPEYKTVVDGPWLFVIESDSEEPVVNLTIRRDTQYHCSHDNKVEFHTKRNGNTSAAPWVRNKYEFLWRFSGLCELECNSQNVSLQVAYKNKRINGTWSLFGNVTYLYKNCDKLYWTNWIETTNCSSSRHWDYVRNCKDCDGDEVDEKHCDGNSTMQEDCQPIWSKWIEVGPCVVTGCSLTTGERKKRRECLYGDGSEAMNYDLCSNTSAIVMEQCTNNTLPIECSTNTASLYIGIGVVLVSIVILCILLAVVLYHRRKCRAFSKNSKPNQIPNTHELLVTESIAMVSNGFGSEQSVAPSRYDCEHTPSSHDCELKQTIERPIYENFQARFSGANERGELLASSALELEQSIVPSENELEQREKLDEYESNIPHGGNAPTVSQPTYFASQKHGKSSLASTIPVTESEYSRLSLR